jgi:transcriptional regulator with XRE-family HTH domain
VLRSRTDDGTETMRYRSSRIAEARRAAGLTQRDLGELIGKTANTVARYEQGTCTPNPYLLGGIATVCGVSIADLYDPDDPDDPVTRLANELKAVVAGFPPLDERQRAQVRALLRGVAS